MCAADCCGFGEAHAGLGSSVIFIMGRYAEVKGSKRAGR